MSPSPALARGGDAENDCRNAAAALNTSLLVRVEMPAMGIDTQFNFNVKPSVQNEVYEAVQDLVHVISKEYEEYLVSVNQDGTAQMLEYMRKRALTEMEVWMTKLKMVDEWKMKVERASKEMNKMRDAYFKELFHLREQVYQKNKSEKEGTTFQPAYAMHFDPSEYSMEEEVCNLLREKVQFMQQEFDHRRAEVEVRYAARVASLTEQLRTTKLLMSRKEIMFDKMMKRHGYQDMKHVQEELGAVKVNEAEIDEKINKKCNKAIVKAEEVFAQQQAEQKEAAVAKANAPAEPDEVRRFHQFLERKFGSMKEAKVQIGLIMPSDQKVGVAEIQALFDKLGYATDAKRTFVALNNGQPFITLSQALDRKVRMAAATDDSDKPALKRSSTRSRTEGPFKKGSDGGGLSAILEDDDSVLKGALKSPLEAAAAAAMQSVGSDSDLDSDCRSSCSSRSSRSSAGSKVSRTSKASFTKGVAVANSVSKAAVKFKSKGIKGKANVKRTENGTNTTVSVDTGITSAFADTEDSVNCFLGLRQVDARDVGTSAQPFEICFPKTTRCSRAVQSQIDGRMLDKAVEFFDKTAEDNWNSLAGVVTIEEVKEPLDMEEVNRQEKKSEAMQRLDNQAMALKKGLHNQKGDNKVWTFGDFDGAATRPENYASEPVGNMLTANFRIWRGRHLHDVNARAETFADMTTLSRQSRLSSIERAGSHFHLCRKRMLDKAADMHLEQQLDDLHARPRSAVARRCTLVSIEVQAAPNFEEFGIQCEMQRVVMLSPLEKWFPADQDAHEIQLDQVLEMALEIETRLPAMRQKAEQLVAAQAASNTSEKEQEVIQQLQRLQILPRELEKKNNSKVSFSHGSELRKGLDLSSLLIRHGIAVDAAPIDAAPVAADDLDEKMPRMARRSGRAKTLCQPRLQDVQRLLSPEVTEPEAARAQAIGCLEPDVLRRRKSTTARPMTAVDNAHLAAKRRSSAGRTDIETGPLPGGSLEQGSDTTVANDANVQLLPGQLQPGWSGQCLEASFSPRQVKVEVEKEAPEEQQPPEANVKVCRVNKRLNTSMLVFADDGLPARKTTQVAPPRVDAPAEPAAQAHTDRQSLRSAQSRRTMKGVSLASAVAAAQKNGSGPNAQEVPWRQQVLSQEVKSPDIKSPDKLETRSMSPFSPSSDGKNSPVLKSLSVMGDSDCESRVGSPVFSDAEREVKAEPVHRKQQSVAPSQRVKSPDSIQSCSQQDARSASKIRLPASKDMDKGQAGFINRLSGRARDMVTKRSSVPSSQAQDTLPPLEQAKEAGNQEGAQPSASSMGVVLPAGNVVANSGMPCNGTASPTTTPCSPRQFQRTRLSAPVAVTNPLEADTPDKFNFDNKKALVQAPRSSLRNARAKFSREFR